MNPTHELDFLIDGFSPDTMPMSRLAQYMLELAALYGSEACVHFMNISPGSVVVNATVEERAAAAVESRLRLACDPAAPDDLLRAYHNINGMLKVDKAVGEVRLAQGLMLSFAGRNTLVKKAYRVREAGVLDGVVIRIGGKDNTIPVWLKDADGAIYKCEANREIARELAAHYLEAPVRVTGLGDWLRGEGGAWLLDRFRISGFEALDQTAIPDIINVVRLAQGNGWNELDDPVRDHLKMRSIE